MHFQLYKYVHTDIKHKKIISQVCMKKIKVKK